MKTLQNNFTTPEQSKRLLELGVPANSADCYYIDSMTSFHDKSPHIIPPYYKYSDGIPNGYESRFCPCWSAGRLIEICKICVTDKNELCEIFDELEMCVDETTILVQTFKEFRDVIDFSKLEV